MSLIRALIRELGIGRKYVAYHIRQRVAKYIAKIQPHPKNDSKFSHNLNVLYSRKAQARREAQKRMNWREWLQESYQNSCSMKSAKLALLDACATAHAAEAAADMGIDVANINFVEETVNKSSLAENERKSNVVAYIEAPNVTDEDLAVFVSRIQKECPVAAQMGDIIYKRK